MRRHRCAKIVATLGPATSTRDQIMALFQAGADVFRLNFSHGTLEDHKARYQLIREVESETGRPISVIADMQGPKLRVGRFADSAGIDLKAGQRFRLDMDPALGDQNRVCLPHPEILSAIAPGRDLLLNDGRIRLRVEECGHDHADTTVVTGGRLSDHKGVNVPGVVLPIPALTDKDRTDLANALDMGADWIALSFVQRPDDVAEARKLINGRAGVLVKIEMPAAVESLRPILELTDAVMVARGDLGVEMPPEDVPGQQKRIVRACRQAGKPVVVATQMLESMIQNPSPTRAEASDVATAVYEGADAVMLSGETAVGAYPVGAVTMMNRIIRRVETDAGYRRAIDVDHPDPDSTAADAICAAARQVAETINAVAIVTFTSSGFTSLRAARERPTAPVLGLTSSLGPARRMALVWGVHTVQTKEISNFAEMVAEARTIARQEEFGRAGDRLVVIAGVPFGTAGTTNILRVAWIEE